MPAASFLFDIWLMFQLQLGLHSISRKWNHESERTAREMKGENGLSPCAVNVIIEMSFTSYSRCLCLSWLRSEVSKLDSGPSPSLSHFALNCLLLRNNGIPFISFCVLLETESHVAQAGLKYTMWKGWDWLWFPDPPASTYLQSAGMTDLCHYWGLSPHFYLVILNVIFVVISKDRKGSMDTRAKGLGSIRHFSLHLYNYSN